MSPEQKIYDCIVVGSGPAGAHAAWPLVEAGLNVAMIDGGVEDQNNFNLSYDENFESVRKNRQDQQFLFFGKDLDGLNVPQDGDHASAMLSGRFSYVSEKAAEFLPSKTLDLEVAQTLAKGGLSEVWGGATDALNEDELALLGLPKDEMGEYYQDVINRIGISGPALNYKTQSAAELSNHGASLLKRSQKNKSILEKLGLTMRPSALALLTEPLGERKATLYRDLDYWTNQGRSLYRARFTVEELERQTNFCYIKNNVVKSIHQSGDTAVVNTIDFSHKFSRKENIFRARYVVVAAGALNTTRIFLKSFGMYDKKVNIITKPHIITPCLDYRFIGKVESVRKHSLCQLVLEGASSYSQIYTYKSLLLNKLLNFSPLTVPESLSFFSLFISGMVLVDSRMPSFLSQDKTCKLINENGRDILKLEYKMNDRELSAIKVQMKIIKKGLRKLGLIPIKEVYMKEGSSAHYAGGMTEFAHINGKVNGFSRVFVADSSLWKALPSKPPTLTIMANANRIGSKLARTIKS